MKDIRIICILIVGGLLTCFEFQSQFKASLLDSTIELGLILLGIIIFISILVTDLISYEADRQLKNFALTFLCLTFAALIAGFHIKAQINFNKPSLLKVFYDGDFNGIGIDFKTDGTYIFDNFTFGSNDYFHGSYKISENRITLDKDQFSNLKNLKYLEIREEEIEDIKSDLYLYQIDSLGNSIENSLEFRVTIDNRIIRKKK